MCKMFELTSNNWLDGVDGKPLLKIIEEIIERGAYSKFSFKL